LNFIFSKETAYKNDFDENNPSKNHCAIVSLFLNKKFGYEVYKVKIGKSWHYFNKQNNKIIDETSNQFNKKISYKNIKLVNINTLEKSIKNRFELFLNNNIKLCNRNFK